MSSSCHFYCYFFSQKDELPSDTADAAGVASITKSLDSVLVERRTITANYTERVDATDQPRVRRNGQQRSDVSTRLARPQLSPSSASSCSSGEFIPSVRPAVLRVAAEQSSALEQDSLIEHGSTLTRYKLRSISRDEVLRLLSRQRDEISRREAELSELSSGTKLTLMLTDAYVNVV